jgi:hypothetical protein
MQYQPVKRNDDALRLAMVRLVKNYGRYGYRKIAELLRIEGWSPLGRLLRNRLPGNGGTTRRLNAFGAKKGCSCRGGTGGRGASTTKTVQSSGSGRSIQITSGAWTLFTTSSAMAEATKC